MKINSLENVSQNDLRELQLKELEILIHLRDICLENDLSLFLAGGSMIGAVRNQGFIPWDDDVDCFMLRKDYEKLTNEWDKLNQNEKYSLCRTNQTENYHHTAMTVKDNTTTFINSHSVDNDINHGISIDIIPIDVVPRGRFSRIKQILAAMTFSVYNAQRVPNNKGGFLKVATKLLLVVIPGQRLRYKIWKKAESMMSQWSWDEGDYLVELVTGPKAILRKLEKRWFAKSEMVLFEQEQMPVPIGYKEYLALIFGDYMTEPPKSEQVPKHDIVCVDTETSYTAYKGKYYKVKEGGHL
ncbi:LicD family protein [Enterococcus sp. BWM-S5]|uniref:LicD family protein n=1 Tax=Enterococcus larvae TaxID=2794352 RepID=A0ABS4CIS4_9ENTE|nr:LicD family protein [Enterococcus larvae]MBP1046355.1 LicD family protein [Enterococcus larvae]